jgi:hypothetical protein
MIACDCASLAQIATGAADCDAASHFGVSGRG